MSDELEVDCGIAKYQFDLDREEHRASQYPIIDASTNTSKALTCLYESGVTTVIRYYCRDPKGSWKVIQPDEAQKIVKAKLKLCIVYEVSAKASYFSYAAGLLDGRFACKYGMNVIGQPKGSAIYFAVDFDASSQTLKNKIIPYFNGVIEAIKEADSPYRIGVYGSGLTCRTILDEKMAEFAWLAQSTGWREYAEFKASKRWALLQKPTTDTCEIEVDFDEASVADFGAFDQLEKTPKILDDDGDRLRVFMTSAALDGLDEGFKAKVILLLQECAASNIKMVPYFGLRSPRDQAKLWRQSRTAAQIDAGVKKLRNGGAPFLADILATTTGPSGPHVTNALPGLSWHQWGEAVDCYREINGHANWDEKNYEDYADIAESSAIGLTAGGHWNSFKDWPHVQLRPQAGPQNLYSYPVIDAKMQEMWDAADFDVVTRDLTTPAQTGAGEEAARVIAAVISDLSKAADTRLRAAGQDKPYFFPNGIFKLEIALGILAEAPGGSQSVGDVPGVSARVMISGIDKE